MKKTTVALMALGLFAAGAAFAQAALPAGLALPASLTNALGSNPVCVNVSDNMVKHLDVLGGYLVLVMGAMKPISWFLGVAGGKMEDSSQTSAVKLIGKATTMIGFFLGCFSVAGVPASVRYKLQLSTVDRRPKV